MNANVYCPPHLRPGFNEATKQPAVSGFDTEPEEPLRAQGHEELIKFISDAWNNVLNEFGEDAYYIDDSLLE